MGRQFQKRNTIIQKLAHLNLKVPEYCELQMHM